MKIADDLKKRILSKIEEGYKKGGQLIESGEVALYPDPAPAVDPTVHGSGKILQVDSDLLRDLLNWATSAEVGSIDAVVAKAEEMGVGIALTPEHLIDLTATANTADPSNPSVVGTNTTPGMAPSATSPIVPAGPVGPLSPVMQSFVRRGNRLQETKFSGLSGDEKLNKPDAKEIKVAKRPGTPEQLPPKAQAQLHRAYASGKSGEDTLYGNESEDHLEEDDVIDSDNEAIVNPDEMGNKNPDIKANGGQQLPKSVRPIGKLNDPANMGGEGLAEDGIEGVAASIADGIADGIVGDTIEEPEVNALPGEGIPQDDNDAAINAELGEPVSPPISPEGSEGLVSQVASLQSRVAELEALLGGNVSSEAPEDGDETVVDVDVDPAIGADDDDDDELSIDSDEDSEDDDSDEDSEEDDGDEDSEEGDEDSEEDKDEDDEESEKLLLGGDKE